MMKHTLAARAALNPRTPRFVALLAPAVVALLAACQGAPEPELVSPADETLASSAQSLTAAECRDDLRTCLSAGGGGVSDFGQCTVDFETCFTDAALDSVGQGQLLADCRTSADGCLSTAASTTDVSACGDVLIDCADDVLDDTRGIFPFVRPLVTRVLGTSVRAVRGIFDVADALPAVALSGVRTCRDEVVTCLDAAVTDLDIGICADSLDHCVDGVVDVLDPVLDPLPGPNGSGIMAATDVCRGQARDCLVGAVSLTDVSVCGDVLGACVDSVEDILNETVDDVNDIIDPLAVPKPANVIDCTLDLAECLAALDNPFDCAEQARICASQ